MAAEIPARQRSGVGKQGVHAGLWLWRIKDELSFSVLLQDCIVVVHGDRPEGISVGSNPDAKNREVDSKCENGRSEEEKEHPQEDSPESFPKLMG